MSLDEEKVAVIDWFIKHNVSSISPQTSIYLSDIAEKVRAEIARDPDTPKAIRAYAVALDMAARAGHIQQGVVIEQLRQMVERAKA